MLDLGEVELGRDLIGEVDEVVGGHLTRDFDEVVDVHVWQG